MTPGRLSISSSEKVCGPTTRERPECDSPVREAVRPHKFPVAAVIAICLVLAFEIGYVHHYRYRFRDSTYSLAELKRNLMTSSAKPDDVAIFGNSRFYHVDPARLKEVFGKDARITNYAWARCGVETYEAMLQGLIAAHRPPKVLLVDGNPEFFGYREELLTISGDPANQSRYSQTAPFFSALRVELAQHLYGPAWQTIEDFLTPPSIFYGERVRKGVKRLLEDRRSPKPRQNFGPIVGEWQHQGWLQFAPERIADEQEFYEREKLYGPYKLYDNRHVQQSYERFLALAQKHDIVVIMLQVPVNRLVFDSYESTGVFDAYGKWLDGLEKQFPVFKAPPPRRQYWPGALGDAGHLNRAGIRQHMDYMVATLRKQLPS